MLRVFRVPYRMESARRYYEVIKEIDSLICEIKLSQKQFAITNESFELLVEAQNRIQQLRSIPPMDLRPLAAFTIVRRIEEVLGKQMVPFYTLGDAHTRRESVLGPPIIDGITQYMQSIPDPV